MSKANHMVKDLILNPREEKFSDGLWSKFDGKILRIGSKINQWFTLCTEDKEYASKFGRDDMVESLGYRYVELYKK